MLAQSGPIGRQDQMRGRSHGALERLIARMALVILLVGGILSAAAAQTGSKWVLRAGSEPAGPAAVAGGEPRDAPAVTAIEITKSGEKAAPRTRVTLILSEPADATGFLLAAPERAIIDMPEVSFRLVPGAGNLAASARKSGLLISGFRFGRLEAGKSRVVLDLTGPARIVVARLETAGGNHQFVVEFEPASKETFLAAVQMGAPRLPADAPLASLRENVPSGDQRPVVVLDPGHGGIDAGARGAAQASEKHVVLAFAQTLAEKLEKSGRYKIITTRSEDVFVSLSDRVKIARAAGAKLFISIHADTLNERWVEGATVYTVSDKASDSHAARLAEKENLADKLAGVEGGEDTGGVSDILFDLTRKETRTFSHYFARSLVAYWQGAGKLNKNPIRSAGFRVLMAPDVPSVLLELGYLSSKVEAAKLTQPEWRAKAAAAVALSVDAFFSPGSAHPPSQGLAPGGNNLPKAAGDLPIAGVAGAIQ